MRPDGVRRSIHSSFSGRVLRAHAPKDPLS